jgi:Fic family protein
MSPLTKRQKAIMLSKKQLSVFVCDSVNLEGIPLTLPEIQTLMDGITIGGHKLSDQQIAINQIEAWKSLFRSLEQNSFEFTKEFVCRLHAIAAKDEALEWGQFRSGNVTIAGTITYKPPTTDKLDTLFLELVQSQKLINDIYDRGIFVFLAMARTQFFFDVNKRLGRLMMNGIFLDAGVAAINVPAKRQLEFNTLMLDFYESNDQRPMNTFLRSCLNQEIVRLINE